MKHVFIKIAEHHIHIMSEAFNLLQPFLNRTEQGSSLINPEITLTIKENYGGPFENFDVDIVMEDDRLYFRRADYLIETSLDYSTATISVYNDFALKHALLNFYSHYVVHHEWGLVLHSSCVVEAGVAHLFSGHSGAGKSTAAKLSLPREILSDEASIVKIDSDGIQVYHSPFRSELDSPLSEAKPLKSIHLLNQSRDNKREQIRSVDAFFQMMDKVFYWKYNTTDTKKVMVLLNRLVNKVPVYQLYFQKNDLFWELIS